MAEFTLNAEVRTRTGKGDSNRLRMKGLVPAVIYGNGINPVHCSLGLREFEQTLAKARRNSILALSFQGKGQDREVIIRDFQKNPITHHYSHIDFLAIDMKLPIKVEIEFNFLGEPIGKKSGAIFTVQLRTVKIQCLPSKIPTKIDLDVSSLDVGHSIHVADLPKGDFKTLSNPKLNICQMSIVKEEVVVAPVVAAEGAVPAEGAVEGAAAGAVAAAPGAAPSAPGAPAAAPAGAKKEVKKETKKETKK